MVKSCDFSLSYQFSPCVRLQENKRLASLSSPSTSLPLGGVIWFECLISTIYYTQVYYIYCPWKDFGDTEKERNCREMQTDESPYTPVQGTTDWCCSVSEFTCILARKRICVNTHRICTVCVLAWWDTCP